MAKIKNILLKSSLFVAALVLWQALHASGVMPVWLLPGPKEAFLVLWRLVADGTLLGLVAVSLGNLLPAFAFSVLAALVAGVTVGMSKTFSKMFSPFLSAIYLVPSLAWLPIIILFLGFTRQSIWALIFISSFTRIIYSVIGGVRGININWLLVAQNLGLSRASTITKVILPGALPQILSGVRVGFGSAWRSLIGAEMLVVTAGGLGKYIWMSQWGFKMDQVLAGITVIALIGILSEVLIFKKIEQITLAKWGMLRA